MIKIIFFGKSLSGGASNIRDLEKYINRNKLPGFKILKKSNFFQSFKLSNNDHYVIWMVNHLTFILSIYLFFVSFYKKIKISAVVHNDIMQPQTSSLIHNFISTTLEQFTFFVSNNNFYFSKILFMESTSRKKYLISDVLPFDYDDNFKSLKKDIDVLYIGRNLPYKNLDLLNKCLRNLNHKLVTFVIGKDVSKFNWQGNNLSKINVLDSYINENEYRSFIMRSKLVVLPYKFVSAAGPLVDSLSLRAHVLVSDLPFFRMYYKSKYVHYFKSNDVSDLSNKIKSFLISYDRRFKGEKLNYNNPYSWKFLLLRLKELSDVL